MLHEQHFDDLCEIDSDSLHLSPTFRSTSFVSDLTDVFSTDHFLVTVHFDFLMLTREQHAPSYIKQRQCGHTCFDFYSATSKQKEAFIKEVSSLLSNTFSFLSVSTLNQIWYRFKSALLSAGCSYFPKKIISLMKPKAIPHELQPFIHLGHSLDHFTIFLQKLTSIF
ncbi:unnamed protein product [Rhizophagus irregularis]|uniref:Uncharacterized protein n=1 Tax=Rhizophagus irregularis TaxID=588596 RepID=A0A2N1NU21_9GLOM|nr:hypothetical protein RhiirC2_771389 [Rhizophagus irregularis]CAB4386096.1 unnamed protein product [Rhizophagus irregularis]CAB5374127.1 unnamed protein product [Rhizophagus irregularis]